MSNLGPSRFAAQSRTTHERLSTNTVGLVALSDFRKRRAEVLEAQEREARDALSGNATSTPDRSQTATPNIGESADAEQAQKRKKKRAKALVSFGDEFEEDADSADLAMVVKTWRFKSGTPDAGAGHAEIEKGKTAGAKLAANLAVGILPRPMTKAVLERETAERDALRKEFLDLQAVVKATEIAMPFVFYDGTNIPGGTVTVKKGDFIWLFLDKSRKVGAQLGVGGEKMSKVRREWARVSVDDLMLVRGSMIIPHHYEIYFFIINKSLGPGNQLLFDYSGELPRDEDASASVALATAESGLSELQLREKVPAYLHCLEGFSDDPTFTKVVDRRWYERNKHIYPASTWQEFDPGKDYQNDIRRDLGGNAFFFSR